MKNHPTMTQHGCALALTACLLFIPSAVKAASPVQHFVEGSTHLWISEAAWPLVFVVSYEGDRGDFVRKNRDGSWLFHMAEPECSIQLAVYTGPDRTQWPVLAEGIGMCQITATVVISPSGEFSPNGEVWHAHARADLELLDTGEVATMSCQFVMRDWVTFLYKFEYEPLGLDIDIHK
ncbi:MAG: hypothetical protein JNK85_04430 [Verrucomicrobiales bacterium]|nr:hypothetical protein [Verrucomicrobiales bacterium]